MTEEEINKAVAAATNLQRAGRLAEAAATLERVLAAAPRHAHALNGLGTVALQSGRYQEAATYFHQAHLADPMVPGFLMNLGTALLRQRRFDDAAQAYRQMLRQSPQDATALSNLAVVLAETGKMPEALEFCRRAVAIDPTLVSAYLNLGTILRKQGDHSQAADAFRKALELAPGRPDLLTHLGLCLARMGQTEEAIALHRQAIEAAPNFAGAFNNLGICLHDALRISEAIAVYRQGLAAVPDDVNLHMNLGFSLLLDGQWEQGFAEYEWRMRNPELYSPQFLRRRWDGSDPSGKTILLHAEQGIGDTFHVVRYAKLLADRGAHVVVETQREAVEVVRRAPGVEHVIAQGEALPPFDFQFPLLSLLFAFNTRLDSLPATIPYLSADPHRQQAWAERFQQYGAGTKIGLVWAGSAQNRTDSQRSIALATFAPLAAIKGIRWFSLQKGAAAIQVFSPPAGLEIVDLAPFLNSFDDTAAAIANLDLLISVDTAVVHLAGAMGRPVWTLLQFAPDWRWLLNRKDTPWYPTMKLFRQPKPEDWRSVMTDVTAELDRWLMRSASS